MLLFICVCVCVNVGVWVWVWVYVYIHIINNEKVSVTISSYSNKIDLGEDSHHHLTLLKFVVNFCSGWWAALQREEKIILI